MKKYILPTFIAVLTSFSFSPLFANTCLENILGLKIAAGWPDGDLVIEGHHRTYNYDGDQTNPLYRLVDAASELEARLRSIETAGANFSTASNPNAMATYNKSKQAEISADREAHSKLLQARYWAKEISVPFWLLGELLKTVSIRDKNPLWSSHYLQTHLLRIDPEKFDSIPDGIQIVYGEPELRGYGIEYHKFDKAAFLREASSANISPNELIGRHQVFIPAAYADAFYKRQ
jgi:hypothetical protein